MMFVLWLIHLPMRNAAIVDFGWALGLGMLAVGYAIFGGGWQPRCRADGYYGGGLEPASRPLPAVHPRASDHPEEGRYQELRRKWKTNLPVKFLAFFEFQALLDVVLSLPFLVVALNPAPGFSPLEWAGVVLWGVALLGEIVADSQLAAFKKRPGSKGHTCQAGLWRYSRHPNYFFEWLIWVAFALFALASPYGYLGLVVTRADPLLPAARHRHSGHRRAGPAQPRRRLPPLPADHQRVRAVVSKASLKAR